MDEQFNQIVADLLARGLDSMADRFRKMFDSPRFPFLGDIERKIFLNEMAHSIAEV